MLRDQVAPTIREFGFKGSGRNFRQMTERGDLAFVNFQGSDTSTSSDARFYINVSVLPAPWFEVVTDPWPQRPKPSYSFGLYQDRLDPPSGQRWSVTDELSSHSTAREIVAQLTGARGLPLLIDLLDRDRMIDWVRRQRDDISQTWPDFDVRLAVLLADERESAEYHDAVERVDARRRDSDPHGAMARQLAALSRYRDAQQKRDEV